MQIGRKDLHCRIDAVKQTFLRKSFRLPRLTIVTLFIVFLGTDRSPAPIVETPDNLPPPPTQTSKPKWKQPARTKTSGSDNQSTKAAALTGPARFAGNWSGVINQGILGTIRVAFAIDGDGTSVRMGSTNHPATVSGNTITWRAGWLNEIVWTLTPASGSTAAVTSKSGFGVDGNATFVKAQQLVSAPPPNPAVPTPPAPNLPTAKPVSDKPGFVYNPYDPAGKAVFDVRKQAHGATVRDPASGRLFIVP